MNEEETREQFCFFKQLTAEMTCPRFLQNAKISSQQRERVYTGSSRLHTSGSSRTSYLRFIQTVIPLVHLEFSYLRFIQISFIHLVHLDFFSYLWFIQNIILLVHLDFFHTSGSSRTSYLWFIQSFLPVSACKLHIRSNFGQI